VAYLCFDRHCGLDLSRYAVIIRDQLSVYQDAVRELLKIGSCIFVETFGDDIQLSHYVNRLKHKKPLENELFCYKLLCNNNSYVFTKIRYMFCPLKRSCYQKYTNEGRINKKEGSILRDIVFVKSISANNMS